MINKTYGLGAWLAELSSGDAVAVGGVASEARAAGVVVWARIG